jgi:MFS family permease
MNAPLDSIARDLGFAGDNVLKGAVVTVMIVGGVIGGVVIGPTSDSIGRRTALGVTTIPLMVRAPLCSSPPLASTCPCCVALRSGVLPSAARRLLVHV